ncbi:MAG: glycosyltransferase [Lentisphaerota bacterium]
MLDVSVIVLTNNRSDRCRDSVLHNAKSMDGLRAEILVINNGQAQPSLPADCHGLPCRIIQMPTNLGAAARNEGLKASQGRFILTLDDDAYIDPGLVANMIRAFDADASLGALTFRIHNGKEEESCLLPTVFHGCACGFRSQALHQVGGYPLDYLYYGEEYDLAFRLYQRGYRIGLCNHGKMVRHVRDSQGRDTNRILRLLVRNNIFLWASFFPVKAILPALFDTLQRYAAIAAKENAMPGFRAGVASMPGALLRGLRKRQPMSREVFELVSLNQQVRLVGEELRRRGIRDVALCGVGKFPSLWMRTLKQESIRLRQFLDFNPCWKGRRIHGIPVNAAENNPPVFPTDCGIVTGTASLADNDRWLNLLDAQRTGITISSKALSSERGIFDLHRANPLKLYFEGKSEETSGFPSVAPALLYCVPAE